MNGTSKTLLKGEEVFVKLFILASTTNLGLKIIYKIKYKWKERKRGWFKIILTLSERDRSHIWVIWG